jgi:predicted RNase H-like HicB family nuclease
MRGSALTFTGVIVQEGVGYTALCLEVDVASQGETAAQAKEALLEAVTLYLESAIESNLPYIRPVPADEDPRQATPQQVVEVFPLRKPVEL